MGIFMYDVKFGDCFQLKNNLFPKGLVVDFGSMSNIGSQFDAIIDHFNETKPNQLLLSHYHLDHLSGLLYMMTHGHVHKFKEILIPDIFSTRGLRRGIVLLYLNDFLDNCVLPRRGRGRQYTLLEFVTYLCVNPMKVTLLKRGDLFRGIGNVDTCTVLWPDEKYIVDYADELLQQFDIDSTAIQELTNVSETLAELVLLLTELGENNIGYRYQESLITIQKQLDTIFDRHDLENQLLNHRSNLKDCAHSANIVFHNSASGGSNFLFTGDIETRAMAEIEKNLDKKPEFDLHKEYKYIKIPHHGTFNHFYDFSGYSPSNILIPNGRYRDQSYKITKNYAKLCSIKSKMYCSNCNWCEQWMAHSRCGCGYREIIWRDIQKYII